MNVPSTGGVDGARPVQPIRPSSQAERAYRAAESTPARKTDQVEISTEAKLLNKISELPDIRADKVAELKRLIAEGAYDTEERVRGAVDRMIDESL
ncbi:MAG: flagellar biosynthesis anti-sigma factor FlgM [Planctomycetes bacterium]|nr:flagellar biosynthesis anti-sigma factor FlgM [Planctomycetota bacterium]